jgi:hypothetical protein
MVKMLLALSSLKKVKDKKEGKVVFYGKENE